MEFEGQYLTYEEYQALEGTLEEMPFNLLEFECRRKINMRTQNRLIGGSDIPQEVKLCEFKMIESANQYSNVVEGIGNGNVASESTDGYSISYITADKVAQIMKERGSEMDDIIREYLLGVIYKGQHLMFAGRDNVNK